MSMVYFNNTKVGSQILHYEEKQNNKQTEIHCLPTKNKTHEFYKYVIIYNA